MYNYLDKVDYMTGDKKALLLFALSQLERAGCRSLSVKLGGPCTNSCACERVEGTLIGAQIYKCGRLQASLLSFGSIVRRDYNLIQYSNATYYFRDVHEARANEFLGEQT